MRILFLSFCALLAACTPPTNRDTTASANDAGDAKGRPPETPLRPASPKPIAASGEWSLYGGQLVFTDAAGGRPILMLSCGGGMLSVRLPGIRPIESEDRLSVGGGGDVEALVAVPDAGATAVIANGPAPEPGRLHALLIAGPGASYGATAIGPLAPVPEETARQFVSGCR